MRDLLDSYIFQDVSVTRCRVSISFYLLTYYSSYNSQFCMSCTEISRIVTSDMCHSNQT